MTMKSLILGIALALSAVQGSSAAETPAKPNIIFLLNDDMGLGDLGCYGGKIEPTPRIDALAKSGTRFTQYYSASPICSPSRCGLITGNFPGRWRITTFLHERKENAACESADFLDPKAPSLPRQLKEAGYATAHIGKWHLGGGRDVTDAPKFAAYGYDEGLGTYESPEPDPKITATNWIWSDKDEIKRWKRTQYFVDKTLDFMKRQKAAGKPAFVNLWLDDVHTPWVPSAKAKKGDSPANLKGVLKELDIQVGRLVDGLKALGVDKNTLIVFTSDNGPLPNFNGDRNAGFRGHKLALWEAGIRMPFFVSWPGHVQAGRVDEMTFMGAVDMFPTLCTIAGAKLPDGYQGDGQDMSSAFLGKSVEQRNKPLCWEYGRNDEHFKFGPDKSPNVAIRDGNWKVVMNADGSQLQLFDLVADKAEKTNVAEKYPDIAKDLKEKATTFRKSLPK